MIPILTQSQEWVAGGIWKKPWLWLPPQWSHNGSNHLLPLVAHFSPCDSNIWKPLEWNGLHFPNPLGIAGGLDKKGQNLPYWQKLGAGFLEVGTVTPKPQGPLPGSVLKRDLKNQALWNAMGFPNPGLTKVSGNLNRFQNKKVPVFISLGKNRQTPPQKAYEDYLQLIQNSPPCVDAFVINLSSPNTEGLRDLLKPPVLEEFLTQLVSPLNDSRDKPKPLLLKISPDMEETTLKYILESSSPHVQGWILTNTTQSRQREIPFPRDRGGVSGEPLKELSQQALKTAVSFLGVDKGGKLVISVGGILDFQEIEKRLEMGADLVQFYSAFVFNGPFFIKNMLKKAKAQPQVHNT